jgi:hypothetical protein
MDAAEIDRIDAAIQAELPELLDRAQRRAKAIQEQSVSGRLRRAIVERGLRHEEVCRETGLTFEQLSDFMTGEPLPSTAIDALAAVVHYELVPAE